jgi:hypothetical protein
MVFVGQLATATGRYGVILIASTTEWPVRTTEGNRSQARHSGSRVVGEICYMWLVGKSRFYSLLREHGVVLPGAFISLSVWHVRITPADATN